MPKSEFRCEGCLNLFPLDKATDFRGEQVCTGCWVRKVLASIAAQGLKVGADPRKKKDPKRTTPPVSVPGVNGTPAKPKTGERTDDLDDSGFGWFAVAHAASDAKVKRAIFQRAKASGQGHLVKKVLIPKVETTRITKDRYDVFDVDGKVVGQVSADSEDDALHKGKEQFSRKKGWAYKPTEEDLKNEVFHTLEKTKEGRRTVYLAKSESGKVLGKISSVKNESAARKQAKALYGEVKRDPRPIEVTRVEKVKEGGETKTHQQRAMPGYLLVRCADDEDLHDTIKRTPGVYSMLPFTEKVDYEKYEDMQEEGVELPRPAPIPDHEVKRIGATHLNEAKVDAKVGDRVQIIGGIYQSSFGTLVELTDDKYDPIAKVETQLIGRNVLVSVPGLFIRKY